METKDYISLKKERKEIISKTKGIRPSEEDLARINEIEYLMRIDPPTLEQKYAAMFE